MKRSLLLGIYILLTSVVAQAQFASQVTFLHAFSKHQVDSIMTVLLGGSAGLITSQTKYDVKIYKVIYNTVGADSLPTTASGLLTVPQHTPCEVPILSYEHSTITRKSDAPSRLRYEWYVDMIGGSMGMISLMPDGLGLGDGPGTHPFLHKQSEATPVIDMIRAVKEIVDTTGASANDQLFLAGFSEGANAALSAHEYIQKYLDSTMHVTATGAISGYLDLSGIMVDSMILSNNPVSDPSYLSELFHSYNSIYHFAAHDSDIFVHPYDSIIPTLFNGTKEIFQINPLLPSVAHNVLKQSVIDSIRNDTAGVFRQLLKKNDTYNWSPNSNVSLFYCNADEIVPYQHSISAYQHFAANGSTTVDTLNAGANNNHDLCGQFSTLAAITIIRQYVFKPVVVDATATKASSPTTNDGTATAHDTLGNSPVHYRWSNGDSTKTISHLAPGTYYVTVTDRSLCTALDSVTVGFTSGLSDISLNDLLIYPNPAKDFFTIDLRNSTEKITMIAMSDLNGNRINASLLGEGTTIRMDLRAMAKGIYILHIRTASGHETHQKLVLL